MFIKKKRIIDEAPFGRMKIDVLATSKNVMQIQIEKSDWDDFFFDIDPEQAIELRNSLNEFIDGRDSK